MISQQRSLKLVPGESSNVLTFSEIERKLTLDLILIILVLCIFNHPVLKLLN